MSKRAIYKYQLLNETLLPPGYKVLMVGAQGCDGFIWCEVDPSLDPGPCGIEILPTGAEVPPGKVHVGSFTMMDGKLVWHIYDTEAGDAK